jgi:hypothetical protein
MIKAIVFVAACCDELSRIAASAVRLIGQVHMRARARHTGDALFALVLALEAILTALHAKDFPPATAARDETEPEEHPRHRPRHSILLCEADTGAAIIVSRRGNTTLRYGLPDASRTSGNA